MSSQKYRRSDFESDDECFVGEVSSGSAEPSVTFISGASSFWKARSLLEKVLLIILGLCVLIIIILSALVGVKHKQVKHMQTEERCTSADCVTTASMMLSAMDLSADPCEDFYQYACGGWMKRNTIPAGNAQWNTFDELYDANEIVLKNMLENEDSENDANAVRKARRYYVSCLDENATIEALGHQPLYDILSKTGGWDISTIPGVTWNLGEFDLQKSLQTVQAFSIDPFFLTFISADEKNNSVNVLQIDQGGISLAREEYNKTINDKVLGAYFKYMNDIGQVMGGDVNNTYDQMLQVLRFEQQIANFTTPDDQRRDEEKLYHNMTIAELQHLAPFVNWRGAFNQLLKVAQYTVEDTEKVIVFAPEFLQKISALVIEMQQTPEGNNTLNNYMMWHLVKSFSNSLSEDFRKAAKSFSKTVNGIEGEREHWKYCVEYTSTTMGFALGSMFVQEVFHGESKDKAQYMVAGVKSAFKNNLPTLKWMDKTTQKLAEEKVDAVVDMIGYPPYILNNTALDEKYQGLEINDDEFFLNNLRSVRYSLKKSLLKLRKPPDKDSWGMTPQEVNAYYSPTKNEIVFPAGILQRPFFDQNFPVSINYGGMGVVMGHELTHGFDDQGREYDKSGTLTMWWQDSSIKRFEQQAQCFVDQYSTYSLNDEHVNGKQTLGENIADNGGITAAYHAYRDWVEANGEEPRLPGLDLTHDQLFFLAFGQVWCTLNKPEYFHNMILEDSHSPGQFRVKGTLSNSKDFAKHFKCKDNSAMNPKNKCVIW